MFWFKKRDFDFSSELDLIHESIDLNGLSIEKVDIFDKQCVLVEKYFQGFKYTKSCKKIKILNIVSGFFALPFLIFIGGSCVLAKFIHMFGGDFDPVDAFNHSLLFHDLIIYSLILAIIGCVPIIVFYKWKSELYLDIYPELKYKLKIGDLESDGLKK